MDFKNEASTAADTPLESKMAELRPLYRDPWFILVCLIVITPATVSLFLLTDVYKGDKVASRGGIFAW